MALGGGTYALSPPHYGLPGCPAASRGFMRWYRPGLGGIPDLSLDDGRGDLSLDGTNHSAGHYIAADDIIAAGIAVWFVAGHAGCA